MSADSDDKYPGETGRRRFVKGVVGGASLAALGTTGAVTINSTTTSAGPGGGATQYFGIENTDGPAPRAMPQIPIEIDDDGALKGVYPTVEEQTNEQGETVRIAEMELGGTTYSARWFQYCGIQSLPGVQPGTESENYFRSSSSSQYEWQQDVPADEPLNVSMFEDYKEWNNDIGKKTNGKPAFATWRSEDVGSGETLTVQVLRSETIKQLAQGNSEYSQWLSASTEEGFIAWLNKCTHFCCVPGFKISAQAGKFGAENEVYCPCHQSVYDPNSIVQRTFTALPRPEED
ncbi:cytochrome B [Halobacteriales archaeon QH_8_64_26]|nr:MAG: cytochrome B [Halobacteriales archaeon QH_8_64_26]